MGANFNPYEAPKSLEAALPAREDASQFDWIRRQHLSHEASLQSVGSLYVLGAAFALVISTIMLYGALVERNLPPGDAMVAVLVLGMGVLQGWSGLGLRSLRANVKIPAGIVAGIGLLAFPCGTLINGYVLYLLFSEKGNYILSPRYQEVIAATPHIRYKTSIIVWIFLAILGVLLLLACAGVFLAAPVSPPPVMQAPPPP